MDQPARLDTFGSFARRALRAAGCVALVCLATAGGSAHEVVPPFGPRRITGTLIVLPGIHNTLFQLDAFVEMTHVSLPGFTVDRRRWGYPFLGIRNLRAAQENREFARALAADIVRLRRERPDEPIYLAGYSGGGGVAALVFDALPDDVRIDRLLLIAPAVSVEFPIDTYAAEHVSEFVVNFASRRDLQVGLGTRLFGTIDRSYEYAAGYGGFDARSDKLVQWHWRETDRRFGHRGNHISYLGRRWQRDFLLPAIDPQLTGSAVEALWQTRREAAQRD